MTYTQWLCKELPKLYLLRCFCFKKDKNHYIRQVANRRIERQLDMVHFLRQQITLNAIIRAKTTKVERKLARRNFKLVVGDTEEIATTESSSSGNDINCKSKILRSTYPNYFY